LWDKLKHNKTSLLLLVGEYDAKFRVINSEMARLCESARLEIASSCGHNIHFENTKIFLEKAQRFLM
jgi:2-succinyl-6-hydroxy-2,4-cyclohexadiene-1-carboxylate synthase